MIFRGVLKQARLNIINSPTAARHYYIMELLNLGRNIDNHVYLNDERVSRYHARILHEKDDWVLYDLNSANGVFVNDRKISKSHKLCHEDIIRIGGFFLNFQIIEDSNVDELFNQYGTLDSELDGLYRIGKSLNGNYGHEYDKLYEKDEKIISLIRQCYEIPAEKNSDEFSHKILEGLLDLIPAHRGAILLRNSGSSGLTPIKVVSRRKKNDSKIIISSTIAEHVFDRKLAITIEDATLDRRIAPGTSIFLQDIRSAMCAPMIVNNKVIGVIYLDTTGQMVAFKKKDLAVLNAVAGPLAETLLKVMENQKKTT